MLTCQRCGIGWPIQDNDKYCGYCGTPVVNYELAIVGVPVYIDEWQDANLKLQIINQGSVPIHIEKIETKAKWFELDETGPLDIPVGKSPYEIPITLKEASLISLQRGVKGRIEVQARNADNKETALEILSAPVFDFDREELVFEYKGSESSLRQSIELNMIIRQSTIIFDDVQPDDPCEEWFQVSKILRLGMALEARRDEFAVSGIIDLRSFPMEKERVLLTLAFKIRGRKNGELKSIWIRLQRAPRLHIREAKPGGVIEIDVVKDLGEEQIFEFHLVNTGGGEIDLTRLGCDKRPFWLGLSCSEPIIKENEEAILTVSVDVRDAPEGLNKFDLTHPLKDTIFEFPFVLAIEIRTMKIYPHYLAVDFGTTNSCCAFIDERSHRPEFVPYGKKPGQEESIIETDRLVLSQIVYTGEDRKGLTYEVGEDASSLRLDKRYSANYFRSIKRYIGEDTDFHIRAGNKVIQLKPYQIAGHITQHLLEKAQKILGKKITRCLVAHPTKFSRREIGELRTIYRELGIEDVVMLDEATAASLEYIIRRYKENEGRPDKYYIAVYDFGGGTTDIALLLVDVKADSKKNILKIDTLYVGGHRRLGGDDLTELIVSSVLKECADRLRAALEKEGVSFSIPLCRIGEIYEPSENDDYNQKLIENTDIIYSNADKMKIALSDEMSNRISALANPTEESIRELSQQVSVDRSLNLWALVGGEMKRIMDILFLKGTGFTIRYSMIEEYLSPRLDDMLDQVEAMLERVQEEQGRECPVVIVLAGQSSAIPLVRQKFEQRFSEAEVKLTVDLKGCVASGLSRYGVNIDATISDAEIEVIDFSTKTHYDYGVAATRFFGLEFETVIPRSSPIPCKRSFEGRLKHPESVIIVYENFGARKELEGNEEIQQVGSYHYRFPDDAITEEDLQKVELEMSLEKDGQIYVVAKINDQDYEFVPQIS